MLPRDVSTTLTIAMVTTSLIVAVTSGAPANLDPEDYEVLVDNEARSIDKGNASFRSERYFSKCIYTCVHVPTSYI